MYLTYDIVSIAARRGVSGSAACRWYINENLPDINNFRRGCVIFLFLPISIEK
jgi:hypothetical protein